jgi:hypothetical protein
MFYLPVRSRWLHPGQQHGRRCPSSSSSSVLRMRRLRVVSCFASSTQQMNSLRASGVMSIQAASAVEFAISACRRSSGSLCTTPPGTRLLVTEESRSPSVPWRQAIPPGSARTRRRYADENALLAQSLTGTSWWARRRAAPSPSGCANYPCSGFSILVGHDLADAYRAAARTCQGGSDATCRSHAASQNPDYVA